MNYPDFCNECWKLNNCKQKVFMLADIEPVDGFADFELADFVCENCLISEHDHQPLFNSEVDSPAHCSICGIPLNCQLTIDGINYVKESIAENNGCCRELWPVLFANYLEE